MQGTVFTLARLKNISYYQELVTHPMTVLMNWVV